ncbi:MULTISPECIES: nitrous oxide reductase family maturation protein NosD [unclassified Methanosarcina]|uniref:right-handed parallel beta-helix repeat-containing protein n=1 Tax=unclassified Methanosarcina TaxID=2644672 RepID=UPI00064E7C41|nr:MULTISPECIES: NosD domain-containing protein [unclassified Methanosarcina]
MSATLAIALLLVSAGVGSADVIYVEPGASIQAAINNSTTGDFVIVKAGDYEENIIVNVSGVTVTSEPESPEGVLIRSGDENSSVFQVKADNVTISGFNITGSGEIFSAREASGFINSFISKSSGRLNGTSGMEARQAYDSGEREIFVTRWNGAGCPSAGICLENAINCTIERNNIFKNRYGVYLQGSMNNTISENTYFHNGIWLDEGCSRNMLINNTIDEGYITIGAHCWDNIMFQNRLSNGGGISIACCGGGNLVSKNEVRNCSNGIDMYDTQARTVLRDNLITDCENGIYLIFVFDARVYNNTISNSSKGIYLREESHNNELFNNMITSSNESGILLDSSTDNRIYNNYFNNSVNVKAENSEGNNWNTTQTSGTNIMEGPYLSGNFWADLNGTGFSQTAEDSDSDGICDLPYNVNGSDFDYLPLAEPPYIPGVDLKVIIGTSEANKTSDVSIELDRSNLDFGTLLPGQASNPQVLNIRNTGKSNVKVTAEIGASSDSVFSEGIYLSSHFWPDFSEVIANSTGKDVEVVLNIPANYSENGMIKGSLVFRAEKV